MEKKGDILNQMALISDLLEKMNLTSDSKSVIIMLNNDEFENVSNKIVRKTKIKLDPKDVTFSIKIGEIFFVFNKNNV